MNINNLLEKSSIIGASDLYISVGAVPTARIGESFRYIDNTIVSPELSKKNFNRYFFFKYIQKR